MVPLRGNSPRRNTGALKETTVLEIRKYADRGTAKLGWLHSRHTFSFADYYDPQHMGFVRTTATSTAMSMPRLGRAGNRYPISSSSGGHSDVLAGQRDHRRCVRHADASDPPELACAAMRLV